MASQEHLGILKQGVEVWNEWRRQNPEIKWPSLSGTDLSGAYLNFADLSKANLRGTDLSKANLSGTDLSEANLRGADLRGANLRGAILRRAGLTWANVSGGDLSGADLSEAKLGRGANLSRANLSRANLYKADLGAANLSRARLSGIDLSGTRLSDANLSRADLRGTDLSRADVHGADLSGADLSGADLSGADLSGANLGWANLSGANLGWANLGWANLSGANLSGGDLSWANLSGSDLSGGDLSGANIRRAVLVESNLSGADLTGCSIYGISAWNLNLDKAEQRELIITPEGEPIITVDNLEVAQFIYLLINNEKLRDVINTLGRKAVLILGRFSPEPRKQVVEALRKALRDKGYLPIVFDFERPTALDFTETIRTLAGLCLFVIADITNPRSSPLELQATVPDYMLPFIPIMQEGEDAFSMFTDLQNKYPWVTDVQKYDSIETLIDGLQVAVIAPALELHDRLLERKTQGLRSRSIRETLAKR